MSNREGVKLFTAIRKVMTCTIGKIQVKLFEKYNMNVSIGTIFNLKPFLYLFQLKRKKFCACVSYV